MANRDIYVATSTFLTKHEGKRVRIAAFQTFVRSGHDLLKQFPDRFKKIEPQFETASKSPSGTRRKAKPEVEETQLEELPEVVAEDDTYKY